MSAFTVATPLAVQTLLEERRAVVGIAGTASYDTNGSTVDLSSICPSKAYGINVLSVSAHAGARYRLVYTPAGSYEPATGKIKILDMAVDPVAEVGSTTDLSATTWVIEVIGK
jgi:hypothetical protein